jgi:hypothetical protein
MNKIILAAFVLCAGHSFAQTAETPNNFKRFYISAGADFTDFQNDRKNAYVGFEYRLKGESSIGLNLGYKESPSQVVSNSFGGQTISNGYGGHNYAFQLQFNHDWSSTIGLNSDKFDIYTGLNLGMTFQQAEYQQFFGPFNPPFGAGNTQTINNTSVDMGGQFGIRYFVYKNIGINLEVNANRSVSGDRFDLGIDPRRIEFRTGLTYKF